MASQRPTVLVFGTYDLDDVRPRTVCGAMRSLGWRLRVCHSVLWAEEVAKLTVVDGRGMWRVLKRAMLVYPSLFLRALMHAPFDLMLITSGGYLDMLLGWWIARLAGARLLFDPLYGLYETVVEDRRLIAPRSLCARVIKVIERFCFRLADVVLVDTEEHCDYFAQRLNLSRRRIIVIPVGAEDQFFAAVSPPDKEPSPVLQVLFYGSMIPLHGADTIVRAARLIDAADVRFTLVGRGQMSERLEAIARDLGCNNVRFMPSVPYATILEMVRNTDVCLGIFGTTAKAQYVVPTKVFECVAAGRPVVTGDTAAIRRLFRPGEHLLTVPCGNPQALAHAILQIRDDPVLRRNLGEAARRWHLAHFTARALAKPLRQIGN
ncbi:MAG: glycosyltransferase family 4 protein [Phycisphaerae bacterium]